MLLIEILSCRIHTPVNVTWVFVLLYYKEVRVLLGKLLSLKEHSNIFSGEKKKF